MGSAFVALLGLSAILLIGFILGRKRILYGDPLTGLNGTVWWVGAPALMFNSLYVAELDAQLGYVAIISIGVAVSMWVVYATYWRIRRRPWDPSTAFIMLSSGYVNAGNLGIPILVGAIGTGAALAPVLVFQLLLVLPATFIILDLRKQNHVSISRRIIGVLKNPALWGVLSGVVLNISSVRLSESLLSFSSRLAEFGIVAMILSFGAALSGDKLPKFGRAFSDAYVAVFLKTVVSPISSLLVGHFIFGLNSIDLLAVGIVASLPAAQSLYIYASPYSRRLGDLRLSIMLSTLFSLPVIASVILISEYW